MLLPASVLVVFAFTGPPGGWAASIVVATLAGVDVFAAVYIALTWRVVPHIPALRLDDWLLVPVSLSILLSCWGLSVTSDALHDAQHDLHEPGLDFPGERTHAFDDYVYFALGVATTFGATDVTVTTPRMRHIVNLNVVLAFVYNSVVVALLVSILIR